MKVILIPGFGEEPYIFDKIEPHIPGEKMVIKNWTLLQEVFEQNLTVLDYAIFLIDKYNIQRHDTVIGHSMGGWIALQIKQLTGCRVIQVSSWTNGKKVVTVPLNRKLMSWMAKKGIGFNPVEGRFSSGSITETSLRVLFSEPFTKGCDWVTRRLLQSS